jgi:TatD DNase family protein
VVGIGECGLDFYWDKDHKEAQVSVFKKQIEWSFKYDKPLIIHMRDATELTYETLKQFAPLKGIMHCYSGSAEMALKFIELGLHISLGGPVTFKNAKAPKEVAKIVKEDRLLIETDAPFLSPHPFRGKTNEPARVKLVAEKIAELRNESFEQVATYTTKNAVELFKLKE